jgi:hypothetical protein
VAERYASPGMKRKWPSTRHPSAGLRKRYFYFIASVKLLRFL